MTGLRILHTSHTGLPDPRIEKTALTMKKLGHELLFLGGRKTERQGLNAFLQTYYEPITNTLRLVADSSFKKRWLRAVDRMQPDIVHAHNLIAAAMMLDTDYPVIYDDHEYWSKQVFKYSSRSLIKRVSAWPLKRITPKWERAILEKYPVLTVGDRIAEEHREIADYVGVTKNYPLLTEVEHLEDGEHRRGCVYVGNDFELPRFLPHRDMSGLDSLVAFDYISGYPHEVMMELLTHYRVGLTPWKPHPFHQYCDPNKNYEYLHAGLQVVLSRSLVDPFKGVRYMHSFEEYRDIPALIAELPDYDPAEIMSLARNAYVWENQQNVILKAYSHALAL